MEVSLPISEVVDEERACVHHPEQSAIAICTLCEEDICVHCHRVSITGYAVCSACEARLTESLLTPWEAAPIADLPAAFVRTVIMVISAPRLFYTRVMPTGGWLKPMIFGLICMLIGTVAASIWQYLWVDRFQEMMADYASNTQVPMALAVPMFFASLPFVVPFLFALHLGLLHMALRLLGAPTTWPLTTRIVGFAFAGYLFQLIPPIGEFAIGHLLTMVWVMNLEMSAARTYFGMGFGRSFLAVLLPFFATALFGG